MFSNTAPMIGSGGEKNSKHIYLNCVTVVADYGYLGRIIYFPRKSSMLVRLRHPESQRMKSLGKTSKDGTENVISDEYLEDWLPGER